MRCYADQYYWGLSLGCHFLPRCDWTSNLLWRPHSERNRSLSKIQCFQNHFLTRFLSGPYTWECHEGVEKIGGYEVQGRCIKKVKDAGSGQSMMACKMTCGKFGTLWPSPTGDVLLSKNLVNPISLYTHLKEIVLSKQNGVSKQSKLTPFCKR